jgi:hypothetical protein
VKKKTEREKRKDKKQKEKGVHDFLRGLGQIFCSLSFSFFVLRRGQKHVLYFCFCTENFFFWKTKRERERKRDKETKTKNEYERKKH